jgi:hypothetical protein
VPLWLMPPCRYGDLRPEGRGFLLTSKNRVNAAGSGFGPDVIFSVDSAAKRAGTIGSVTAGIGLVPSS